MRLEGVPDGYEVVRWGQPNGYNECWMHGHQVACGPSDREVLIVRKIEPVLDLSRVRLKKGWIAQDKDGANYWFPNKPMTAHGAWVGDSGTYVTHKAVHICWRADIPWTERILEIPE